MNPKKAGRAFSNATPMTPNQTEVTLRASAAAVKGAVGPMLVFSDCREVEL
jgi:hypothetical protein